MRTLCTLRSLIAICALGVFTCTMGARGFLPESIELTSAQNASNGLTAPSLSFEVATIKPAQPGQPSEDTSNIRLGRDRIYLDNESLGSLIAVAFGIHDKEIVGIPHDLGSSRFDIEATTSLDHAPSITEFQAMLQNLLKDRFSFRFHWERREMPIYSLTVARNGPHLPAQHDSGSELPAQTGGGSSAGARTRRFVNNSMDDLAFGLQSYLDRPVENDTGLKGRYDFTLTWAPAMSDDTAQAPALPTALKDQLGLQLKPARRLTSVLLVDHIDQPSPN